MTDWYLKSGSCCRKPDSIPCVSFQMPPNPRRPIRMGRRRSLAQAAAASSPGSSSLPCWACGRRSPWFTSTWSTTRESWVSAVHQNHQQHFHWTSIVDSCSFSSLETLVSTRFTCFILTVLDTVRHQMYLNVLWFSSNTYNLGVISYVLVDYIQQSWKWNNSIRNMTRGS